MASRRLELLDALADHVEREGVENASYRALAAAAGVRHNTLTHHFGTRSDLLAAVFQRIAERMATPTIPASATRSDRLRAVWDSVTTPPFQALWPTFFEVLGVAMRAPDQHAAFLRHVTEDWTLRVAQQVQAEGSDEREALALATFLVAAVRGLVIDLGSGGDTERVADAFELLVSHVETLPLRDS